MIVKSYRDLKVWKKAMDLVAESYRLTKLLPKTEACGLTTQIQRAAVSIPANIAEGHGRDIWAVIFTIYRLPTVRSWSWRRIC